MSGIATGGPPLVGSTASWKSAERIGSPDGGRSERWLFVEPGRIGDWVASTVAVRQFAENRTCSIHWAVRQEVAPLLGAFAPFGSCHVIPGAGRPFVVLRLLARLRKSHYDGCCVLSPGRSGWLIGRAAHARHRFGFLTWPRRVETSPLPACRSDGGTTDYRARSEHLVVRGLRGAGLPAEALDYTALLAHERYHPSLSLQPAVLAAAERVLERLGVPGGKALIALQPGAGWSCKQWPADSWQQLAATLRQGALNVLVTAGPGELPIAKEIGARAGPGVYCFAAATDLPTFGGVLQKCDAVVSSDSAAMHIAAAVGTPVVGLFGPTSPQLSGPVGPRGRVSVAEADLALPCRPCSFPSQDTRGKKCARGDLRCQRGLAVESVVRRVQAFCAS